MVNWNVNYRRPARSLTQLESELDDLWPNRQRDLGYVTGYKSASNFTGHNPNSRGIVMAYDIGTYDHGDIGERDSLWLADYLRKHCNKRLYYIIHEMSMGRRKPQIASNKTNWEWVPYTGSALHENHIHISIMDGYWGDAQFYPNCGPEVYDSTKSWGVKRAYRRDHDKPEKKKDRPNRDNNRRPRKGLYWTVERGDTLTEIANYYAVKVSELVQFNDIKNPDKIQVGDYIKIPPPLYWTVERGDSLEAIAAYYGMSYDAVAKNAGLVGKRPIIGTTIRVY